MTKDFGRNSLKRFIRYLYEYKQEKRIRNVGFVKVEAGNEETIVHMQGKGFHMSNERKLVLYLFFEENEKLYGIKYLEKALETPVMNWNVRYSLEDADVSENYPKICGLILAAADGGRYAVTWNDKPVDVSRMEEYVEEEDATGQEEEKAGRNTPEEVDMSPEEDATGQEEEKVGRSTPEEVSMSPEGDGRRVVKIQRKDISRLPRCEWRLANNHFLIHGHNNYRHLVLVEEENMCKLGVPGIYHIKEAEVAKIFGFEEFLPIEELKVSLEPEEKNQDEPFGYWCRPVKKCRTM